MAHYGKQLILALALATTPNGGRAEEVRLACVNGAGVEIRSADGKTVEQRTPKPPELLKEVVGAGGTLVGIGDEGQIFQLREGCWSQIANVREHSPSKDIILAGSRGDQAYIFLQGEETGTTAGALWIASSGTVVFREGGAVEWPRLAPSELGEVSKTEFPPSLAKWVHPTPHPDGTPPYLEFAEPSPWGGILVAVPKGGQEGDLPPEEDLYHVPPKGKPIKLKVDGKSLTHYALVGYGPGQRLLAHSLGGPVLIGPNLKVDRVAVRGKCVWWRAPQSGPSPKAP